LGDSPTDLAGVDPGRFACAQFCDAPSHGPSPDDAPAIIEEALDLRLVPGERTFPRPASSALFRRERHSASSCGRRPPARATPDPVERARALLAVTNARVARALKTPSCGAT
jgi:hypothetical protein